MLRPFNLY